MFKMKSFSRLLWWGCVLGFAIFAQGESTRQAYHLETKIWSCKNTVRVIFTSDKWTAEMAGRKLEGHFVQEQFFAEIMEKIVISANESGIRCTFEVKIHTLMCCDSGNLDNFKPMGGKDVTTADQFFGFDISNINLLFLFLNLFFLSFTLAWKYLEISPPLGQNEIGSAV